MYYNSTELLIIHYSYSNLVESCHNSHNMVESIVIWASHHQDVTHLRAAEKKGNIVENHTNTMEWGGKKEKFNIELQKHKERRYGQQ